MLRRKERNLENIPVGALGLIPVRGCEGLGDKVNDYLVKWRKESGSEHKGDVAFTGYDRLLSLMPMFRDSVPERQKESSKSLFVEKISI